MLVTHIIAGLNAASGGPSYTVPALSWALQHLDVCVRLRYVGSEVSIAHLADVKHAMTAHRADTWPPNVMMASESLRLALESDVIENAILHTHGLWLMPNLYPAWIKKRKPGVALLHSPRGMLAPAALQISKWKKKAVWRLWQRAALEATDCIHATALSEYEEIRAVGLRNPVAVIPNGIHLPHSSRLESAGGEHKVILSLGRLHRKKGLDTLVRAWRLLESRYPSWRVRIVGPSEQGCAQELQQLARSLNLERLSIEAPIYGDDKLALFRSAGVFVLPTKNENFGVVVAEALAAEVPVICSKGAPWSGLEKEQCGWWIDHGVDPLALALQTAMDCDPSELAQMGGRGRAWMARDFSWERVANDMRAVYAWVQRQAPKPSHVLLD